MPKKKAKIKVIFHRRDHQITYFFGKVDSIDSESLLAVMEQLRDSGGVKSAKLRNGDSAVNLTLKRAWPIGEVHRICKRELSHYFRFEYNLRFKVRKK